MINVTIIVVNWNTAEVTCDCLRSIYQQTKDITFEVIVVDNASSDDSVVHFKSKFPEVILIANENNVGFAAANNQAMEISKGQYVLLLNPDTIVLDGAIQKTFAFAEKHPDIGVLGCQVWMNEKEIQETCMPFPSVGSFLIQVVGLRRFFPKSKLFGWINYGSWDRTTEMDVDVVSGMYMLVRKKAIDEVGMMDEAYFVYAEETDWCFRFKKAQWRCVFTPVARIIHLDGGNKSTDLVKLKMFVQMHKSLLIFYRKQRGFISWASVKFIYIISMTLNFVIYSVLSFFEKEGKSTRLYKQSVAGLKFHLFGIEPKQ